MPGYDIFLSYSRADAAAAGRLRARLDQDAGLKAFLDRYALPGGKPWQPELETALANCRALVVLLGPAGIGGWQHREIQLGLDRQTAAAKTTTPFPVIPVLLPGLQPDDVPLGTFLALNTWVDLRPGLDEPEPLQRLIAAAQGHAIDGLTRDLASLRPYRGLLPFREQDAGLFFGRERFVEELAAKVRQRSDANVVAVLGRSGSGKSSVVFAGLFPALRGERCVGQQTVWSIASLRPGRQPLQALIETFDPPDPGLGETETLAALNRRADLLRMGEVSLAQLVIRRIEKDPGTTRQLLYVDQWEELYTQAQPREPKTDEDKARAADARLFVDLVLDAAAKAPCTLVLSVRSDFYPDIQTHDRLRAAVQDCQVSLGPMRKDELTAAIEGPAKALGGSVEPELTRKLLRDIGLATTPDGSDQYDIGKLPLLEYALEQAWAKAKDGRLGVAHYAGLEQELEDRANGIYERLSEQQKAAAKRLFVSLVTPGEGREDTRARITLSNDPVLENVAEAFISDARLIVTGYDTLGARSAEVSHEALIRHWDKLRAWIDENRTNLRTRTTLVADREEWLKQGKDKSLLIEPGLRLEAARRLRDRPGDVVVSDIEEYLEASFRADQRRIWRRRLGFATSVATAIAIAGLAGWGWYQYKQRADETTAAEIWARLDFKATDKPKGPATIDALWDLAEATPAVRSAFLRQLASGRYQVDTLAAGPASVGRAFGLRPSADTIQHLLGPVLDAIPKTSDRDQLQALAQAIQTLGPRLSQERTQAALGHLIDATRHTTGSDELEILTQAIQTLGPTPDQVETVLGPVVDAIHTATDQDLPLLVEAVRRLAPILNLGQARALSGAILNEIGQTSEIRRISMLAMAAKTSGATPEQTDGPVGHLLDLIQHLTDFDKLSDLIEAVGAFGPRPEQAQIALGPIKDALLAADGRPYALLFLARAIQRLDAHVAPEQAQSLLVAVLHTIPRTNDNDELQGLAKAIEIIAPWLGPTEAQLPLSQFIGKIDQTFDYCRLEIIAGAIEWLGPKIGREQAQTIISQLLRELNENNNPYEIAALSTAVSILHPTSKEAHVAVSRLINALGQPATRPAIPAISRALESLGPLLRPNDAMATIESLNDLIVNNSHNLNVLEGLPKIVYAFQPNASQAEATLNPVLPFLSFDRGPSMEYSAAQTLQRLSSILKPEMAFSVLDLVERDIHRTADMKQRELLVEAIPRLCSKLTSQQIEKVIGTARVLLEGTEVANVAVAATRAIALCLPANSATPRVYVASIVELLKWPTTAGPATDMLLQVLHDRVPGAPGKEAGLDATVAWVAATYPDIDLDSPPTYPPPPSRPAPGDP